jgi:seryl-tRNA synthetase
MKLRLDGYLEFSDSIEPLKSYFDKIFAKEIDTYLFKKTKVGEVTKIVNWQVDSTDNRKLLLTIEGTNPKPQDVLLRLRNFLRDELGKEHKIGVRNTFVKTYKISYEPEKMPKGKIEVKVPWVKEIESKENELIITLQNLDSTALEDRYIERIIKRVEEKISSMLYGGKAEHWELLWQSEKKKPVWDKDPTAEMEKRGWIKKFDVGVWLHNPISTKILATLRKIAIDEIIEPLGFEEVILPKTTPLDVWMKTGHVPGSSNSFYYVSRPKSLDPAFWEDFADYVKVTQKIPYDMLTTKITAPTAGICFAQCPPLYWYFQKKTIPLDELPLKYFDNSGVSYRWEGGGLHGLDRDSEFHRIELIWIGTKDQTIEIKEQLLEKYKHVFNDILDFEWRMAWVTPWYMQQAGQVGTEESKIKGTIDFESWLPWRGDREKSEWLEFQNLTIAGTKFSDAWKIKTQKGEEVWSGCSGIGLERWMVTLLSQKGLNPEKWPKEFRKRFGKMPRELKLI